MCTARMSKDPRDGVCDGHGQTHDIRNLFISDGSSMTTSTSANPTLTIVALALRQAEHISREMSAKNI
jgi:choline dehydrogenase-like flavoprotein